MRIIPVKNNPGIWAAHFIKNRLLEHQKKSDRPFVLGLPTGSTPIPIYQELVSFYQKGVLSFKNVITFNMDEYYGLGPDHPQSYAYFMHEHLFKHIDISPHNTHLLNGLAKDYEQECVLYEEKITEVGGIDLFLGGVGVDGHLAFNEPGSSLSSRTRDKELTASTRQANARFFKGGLEEVPSLALTVGLATVMDAREVLVVAEGAHKAQALCLAIEGGVSQICPLSVLQLHPKSMVVFDEAAAGELKVKTLKHFSEIEELNIHAHR